MEEIMIKDKLSKIIYFATPYSVLVSFLYLFGYWHTFDINILEYISISDVIKLSIFPLVTSLTGIIIGFTFGATRSKPITKVTKWISLLVIFILCIVLLIKDTSYLWLVLAFPVVGKISSYVEKNFQLENYFPQQGLRIVLIWVFIGMPIFSFSYGKIDSKKIIKGQPARYAETSIFKTSNVFKDQKRVKFLGLGGNHFFFMSEDNSKIYISNSSEISILKLTKPLYQDERTPYQKIKDFIKK